LCEEREVPKDSLSPAVCNYQFDLLEVVATDWINIK